MITPRCGGLVFLIIRSWRLARSTATVGYFSSLLCLLTPQATAGEIPLHFEYSFEVSSPDGIVFEPTSGHLFVADGVGGVIREFTPQGVFVAQFSSGLSDVKALSRGSTIGGLLLADSSSMAGVQEFTTTGLVVLSGINFATEPSFSDNDAMDYNPITGTVFVGGDPSTAIFEFSTDGMLVGQIELEPLSEPISAVEGIGVDETTGNLFVVSDVANRLYELTPSGELLASSDLLALTGLTDPESVTLDSLSGTLFVGFDNDNEIAVFTIPESERFASCAVALIAIAVLRLARRA